MCNTHLKIQQLKNNTNIVSVVHKKPFATKNDFKKQSLHSITDKLTHTILCSESHLLSESKYKKYEAYKKVYLLPSEMSKYTHAPHAYKHTPMHRLRCYGLAFLADLL